MNPISILLLVVKYGPMAISLAETVLPPLLDAGKQLISMIESSQNAGTLEADAQALVNAVKAAASGAPNLGAVASAIAPSDVSPNWKK